PRRHGGTEKTRGPQRRRQEEKKNAPQGAQRTQRRGDAPRRHGEDERRGTVKRRRRAHREGRKGRGGEDLGPEARSENLSPPERCGDRDRLLEPEAVGPDAELVGAASERG